MNQKFLILIEELGVGFGIQMVADGLRCESRTKCYKTSCMIKINMEDQFIARKIVAL